jgi:hypothetical protein
MNRIQKNETTIYSNAYAKELDDVLVHYLPDNEMAIIIRCETSAQFAVYLVAHNGYIAACRFFWKNQNARDASTFTLCFAPVRDISSALVESGCLLADGSIGRPCWARDNDSNVESHIRR